MSLIYSPKFKIVIASSFEGIVNNGATECALTSFNAYNKMFGDGKFFDDVMARYAKEIADGELPKVGLNCHRIPDEEDTLLKEVAETKIEPCWDHIEKIREYKKIRLLGSAAISLAYVACGRVDAYVENDIKIWDVAAGIALVKAAGGLVKYCPTDKVNVFQVKAYNQSL